MQQQQRKAIEYAFERLTRSQRWKQLESACVDNNLVFIKGLSNASLSLLLPTLAQAFLSPLAIFTCSSSAAEKLVDSCGFFSSLDLLYFAKAEALPFEEERGNVVSLAQRIETLRHLLHYQEDDVPFLLVSSIDALALKVPHPDALRKRVKRIKKGESIELESLEAWLTENDYRGEMIVEGRGEFSIRGGIIDVFPLDFDYPVRIDLFGERVERLRYFDSATQRSLGEQGELEQVEFFPASERALMAATKGELVEFLDLLPSPTLLVLDDPDSFPEQFEDASEMIRERCAAQSGEQLADIFLCPFERLEKKFKEFTRLEHHPLGIETAKDDVPSFVFRTGGFEGHPSGFPHYVKLIKDRLQEGYLICVVCDNEGQVMRFEELLRDAELGVLCFSEELWSEQEWQRFVAGQVEDVLVMEGELAEGCLLPEAKLLFLTDREVFGRFQRRRLFKKIHPGKPISQLQEIKRGDYVVHLEHGIGKFVGIRRQLIEERSVDLLELLYQDGDKLLVPVERIQSVQKYLGVEGIEPPLDRLGGKRWAERKRRSQEKIEKMARELLELYARRQLLPGLSFGDDTFWQREFEASFPYEETPEQLRAIQETKQDMRAKKPMDRLICGDVGFGKTEVALRAAFKALMDRKQAALLVPTTILCQQHYWTFKERMASYPVRVEMLSRFQTASEQRRIVEELAAGRVNVVIGTHRLLSKDIRFHNLGLLIVDEEQRFGVRQKEKIKKLKANVDVLTLTATPIPRTLYMALSGLKDMSQINTPPPGRRPIRTFLIHFEPERIKEAILRELNRGGQVYFVHNRIESINQVAERLHELVPQAKIAVAHGRIRERELEQLMLDFIQRRYDILLSTTIIENGIDIPNVNTIIINRADNFGLAQLYHLRGRVGRELRQAYAYLVVPEGVPITPVAVKRLQTIQEFTELGTGFQIALRDMQIRGSGNILGKEQHGCILDIGFEHYCELLEQTVKQLKGEEIVEEQVPEIKLPINVYLPEEYIPVESLRIAFYKRIADARSLQDIQEVEEELRDRFGILPVPVRDLLYVGQLRILAALLGIYRISGMESSVFLATSEPDSLFTLLERLRSRFPQLREITVNEKTLTLEFKPTKAENVLEQTVVLLTEAKELYYEQHLHPAS